MDFVRAFKYPFHNSAKVISIVLVLTIIFTFFVILVANSFDWTPHLQTFGYGVDAGPADESVEPGAGLFAGLFGLLAFVILGGFWINGYSVDVVRTVMHGNDTMPNVEVGANLRKGFWIFLSGLWYGIAALVVLGILVLIGSLLSNIGGLIGVLAMLAAIIAGIGYVCLSGWAYLIGIAIYAAQGKRDALFSITKNIEIVRANIGISFTLLIYNLILYAIYSLVRGILERLFGAVVGADLVVAATIGFIIYFAVNLFLHFSTQHLIAQYGLALELYEYDMPGKEKLDYE